MLKDKKRLEQQSHLVSRAAEMLHDSLCTLGAQVSKTVCEDAAVLVIKAMSTRNRSFHDMNHAFDVANIPYPIGKIAGLFHDVVYIQVDRSRLPELRKNFTIFDPGDGTTLKIPGIDILLKDSWAMALVDVFGLTPHQEVGPFSGINEFLSAWVTIVKLRDHLAAWPLLQIVTCIEATIPFRGPNQFGQTPSEILFSRLSSAATKMGLSPSEKDLDYTIKVAVSMSNQDVYGFGSERPSYFIGNSWALLAEGNPPLQNTLFTAQDFREAIYKMYKFFSMLSVDKVFLSYN